MGLPVAGWEQFETGPQLVSFWSRSAGEGEKTGL